MTTFCRLGVGKIELKIRVTHTFFEAHTSYLERHCLLAYYLSLCCVLESCERIAMIKAGLTG